MFFFVVLTTFTKLGIGFEWTQSHWVTLLFVKWDESVFLPIIAYLPHLTIYIYICMKNISEY